MDCSLDSEHILQVSSNNRDITKCQKFLQENDNSDVKATAILWVFSKKKKTAELNMKCNSNDDICLRKS